jgi:hypothetical protein
MVAKSILKKSSQKDLEVIASIAQTKSSTSRSSLAPKKRVEIKA